jgi:hypothetical protein
MSKDMFTTEEKLELFQFLTESKEEQIKFYEDMGLFKKTLKEALLFYCTSNSMESIGELLLRTIREREIKKTRILLKFELCDIEVRDKFGKTRFF